MFVVGLDLDICSPAPVACMPELFARLTTAYCADTERP